MTTQEFKDLLHETIDYCIGEWAPCTSCPLYKIDKEVDCRKLKLLYHKYMEKDDDGRED